MTDRELLELIATQVGTLTGKVDNIETKMENLESEMKDVKSETRKTNTVIEHDIKPKIDALFDGYKINSEKLDRIEKEVSKHEEIILRRIR